MGAGHKMVRDANLQDISDKLGCKMSGSKQDMQKTLAMSTLTHPKILIGRQQTILHLRSHMPHFKGSWNERFNRLAEIEKEVAPFFQKEGKDKDSLEDDAIAQLSFQHDLLKPLNHIPWLLLLVSMFKIWLVPAMSIVLPLLIWILPYLLLRFVYALPITQDQYIHILQHLMTGNMTIPEFHGPAAVVEPLTLKSVFQMLMFSFTFVQSIIQPVQNAMHLYKTDAICMKLGKQVLEIRKMLQEFRADLGHTNGIHVKLTYSLEHIDPSDIRMAFISIQDCPENIHMVFRDLAHLECMWRVAESPVLNPVIFSRSILKLNSCVDISLEKPDPVRSSLELQEQPHAILTGPNGGGKSSFLRSVLQCVLLGHAFGFAPATEAFMPRFTWIASGLQLRDTPGQLSMFETEVKFAAECIRSTKYPGPGLILFDELFHSTNPQDSARSATQFLQRLWKKQDVFTIVSTHIFPLIARAPKNVQAICCPANRSETGEIIYSYGVEPGICDVSSVHTVWEKFGLVPAASEHAASGSPAKSPR